MLSIVSDPKKGRCFSLTQDVVASQILLSVPPYAVVPDTHSRKVICATCVSAPLPLQGHVPASERNPLQPCVKCSQVYYHPDCVVLDELHSCECSFLLVWGKGILPCTRWLPIDGQDDYHLDLVRVLLRILVRRARETQKSDVVPFEEIWKLCDNVTSFSRKRLLDFTRIASILAVFVKDYLNVLIPLDLGSFLPLADANHSDLMDSLFTQVGSTKDDLNASLLTLVCKEECNSFGLYSFAYEGHKVPRQGYALAVYPTCVFFNHSCAPNVGHATRQRLLDETASTPNMVFYALEDMTKGTEAFVSYVSLEGSVASRQADLKNYFMFDCACTRCLAELDGKDVWNGSREQCPVDSCCGFMVPWTVSQHQKTPPRNDSAKDVKDIKTLKWTCEGCSHTLIE